MENSEIQILNHKHFVIIGVLILLSASTSLLFVFEKLWMFPCYLLCSVIAALNSTYAIKLADKIDENVKNIVVAGGVPNHDAKNRVERKLRYLEIIFIALLIIQLIVCQYPAYFHSLYGNGYNSVPVIFNVSIPSYEGGTFVTITRILVSFFLLLSLFAFWGMHKRHHVKIFTYKHELDKQTNNYLKRIELERAEKEAQERKMRSQMINSIQPISKQIIASNFTIHISEVNQKLIIGTQLFDFKDIINCNITDNQTTIHSEVTHNSTTTNDTGSMIGRAVVGGLLAGGIGAVIGGATGSKSTTTKTSESESHIKHDYHVIITVNNIANPIIKLHLGENEQKTNEIVAVMNVIIARNK